MDEKKDLTMLNRTVPKKTNGLLIFLLILFIGCICVGSYLIGKSLNNNNTNIITEQKEEAKEPAEKSKSETKKKTFKEQVIEDTDKILEGKGLYKPELVEYRTYNIKKAGYYEDNPNLIYYTIYGEFKCKPESNPANETTCLYQSQLDDPNEEGRYTYAFTISIDEVDGNLIYGDFTQLVADQNFVEINEEIEEEK